MTSLAKIYLVCRSTTDKEATTVAKVILENWFWIFGIPERILSDRGKEFRSKLIEAICAALDVERDNTTSEQPKCDGKQMKKIIRAYEDEDQENWDLDLNDRTLRCIQEPRQQKNRPHPIRQKYCKQK